VRKGSAFPISGVKIVLAAARLSLAAAKKRKGQLSGKPEAFRTSGGKAA